MLLCQAGFFGPLWIKDRTFSNQKLEVSNEPRSQDVHRIPVPGLVLQRELDAGGQDPRPVEGQGAEERLRLQVLRHPLRGGRRRRQESPAHE